MKMKNWLLESGLIALLLGASVAGCGARMEVAKGKILEQIDSLHGAIKIDLRMEDERWKEIEQQGNVDLVEDDLVNGQTTDDYLARIAEVTSSK